MCRRVQCPTCKRPTFAGCGAHIEQVLGDVPAAERCRCRETAQDGKTDPAAGGGGWLRQLFGR